jgi:hypothetical protein
MQINPDSLNGFIDVLASAGPLSERVMLKHIADYKTVLPYVFCGDISREIVRTFEGADPKQTPGYPECIRMLDIFDAGIRSDDPQVRDLVRTSFLENIVHPLRNSKEFRLVLSPALSNEIHRWFDVGDV